jgi:hypothetical protein
MSLWKKVRGWFQTSELVEAVGDAVKISAQAYADARIDEQFTGLRDRINGIRRLSAGEKAGLIASLDGLQAALQRLYGMQSGGSG